MRVVTGSGSVRAATRRRSLVRRSGADFRFPREAGKLELMKRFVGSALAVLLLALVSDGDTCRLAGREYPPDVMVCSGGLAVVCQNGMWQNNDGRRCDGPTGSYIGPQRPFAARNDEPIPDDTYRPR